MWITDKGLCQERITDPHTGITRVISVKVKGNSIKAKQEAFRELQAKIDRLCDGRLKLSEAITLFLKEQERTVKPSSLRKYRFDLKGMSEAIGDSYMENLSAGYVRKKLTECGKENSTLNTYIKAFKRFWRWCYQNDYVKSMEVCDKLTYFQTPPSKIRIQSKYLEPRELKKLLDAMTVKRWVLLTEFLTLTGLRIGEAIALDKVDVWGDILRINKTYDVNNRIITTPKSISSKREIYIQAELKDCIARINEYCKWQAEVYGYETDIFFPDADGGRLKYMAYADYLRQLSPKVLGRKITPHIFRHTHCSMLAAKGFTLEAISDRLGHEDSKITKEIYLHKLEEVKEKENKMLDSFHLIG